MPLVSVVIPVYNGERWLADALRSALDQTHEELEVLVGDDASTDGSLAMAREFAAADPRVRVLPATRNLGAPANQVRLHEQARGAFVKPLLQDDRLAPQCVQRLLEPMLTDPRVVLSTSKRGLIDDDGGSLPDEPWTAALIDRDFVVDGLTFGNAMLRATANLVGEVTTALYRADVVAADDLWMLGGHEYHANGDIVLWLKLLAAGSLAYTPEELSWFRQHHAQASNDARVIARGMLEWLRMPLAAHAIGFLADPADERVALARAAQRVDAGVAAASGDAEIIAATTAALRTLSQRLERIPAPTGAA